MWYQKDIDTIRLWFKVIHARPKLNVFYAPRCIKFDETENLVVTEFFYGITHVPSQLGIKELEFWRMNQQTCLSLVLAIRNQKLQGLERINLGGDMNDNVVIRSFAAALDTRVYLNSLIYLHLYYETFEQWEAFLEHVPIDGLDNLKMFECGNGVDGFLRALLRSNPFQKLEILCLDCQEIEDDVLLFVIRSQTFFPDLKELYVEGKIDMYFLLFTFYFK